MAAVAPRAIVGDVGGTKSRLAQVGPDGAVSDPQVFYNRDFAAFDAVVRAYLDHADLAAAAPLAAAFCFACPIAGGRVALTNYGWEFAIADLAHRFGFARLEVINDFAAIALAVPRLSEDEREQIGPGTPVERAPIAVIGPGTGLGVAGLVWSGTHWIALATEGGHVTMAAYDDREAEVLARLRAVFGHISAERVVSGPGLVRLYTTLTEIDGVTAESLTAAQIATRANDDPLCRSATKTFAAFLGTAAGNLALTLGAYGGVYIGGGVVTSMGEAFDRSHFRARFEAKGRFQPFMAVIPTYVITRPWPALAGLAALLDRAP